MLSGTERLVESVWIQPVSWSRFFYFYFQKNLGLNDRKARKIMRTNVKTNKGIIVSKYNGEQGEGIGFHYKPAAPKGVLPDGSWDMEWYVKCFHQAKAGDDHARQLFFEQHCYLVQDIIKKFKTEYEDDEDMLQNAEAIFFKVFNKYKGEPKKFAGYIKPSLQNEMIDFKRKAGKDAISVVAVSLEERDEEGERLYDFPDLAEEQRFENLDGVYPRAAKLLTPKEMQVVLLVYEQGYSLREVAEILGKTYQYIKELHQRIRNKLKSLVPEGK